MARRIWRFLLFKITSRCSYKYIANQEKHHKTKTFQEEYIDFLKAFEIEYNELYIIKEPI
jgi:hypothetical protein